MAELITIVVELDAKEMREELKRISDRLEPKVLDPLLAKSALEEMRENYGVRDPDGGALRGLSSEYARQKSRRYGGKPLLHASERLWGSLGATPEGDVGSVQDPGYAAAVNSDREFLGVGEDFLGRADEALLEMVDLGSWSNP